MFAPSPLLQVQNHLSAEDDAFCTLLTASNAHRVSLTTLEVASKCDRNMTVAYLTLC
jgi:hypothetical protein